MRGSRYDTQLVGAVYAAVEEEETSAGGGVD